MRPTALLFRSFLLTAVLAVGILGNCATVNPIVCGPGRQLVPPDFHECSAAFLAAVASVGADIAACKVEASSSACIGAILDSVKELLPCEPTCAPIAGHGAMLSQSQHVSIGVQKTNVIESLKRTGYPNAGQ